jgi:predicted DNA-binding transcriptional regulator YafY
MKAAFAGPLDADGADSDLIGITMGIEYVDSGGTNISRRWITISKFAETNKGHLAVEAYCFLRDDFRTFRVSRIVKLF